MATEILKSFSHLQNELEEAKSSLKGVDENIKRLIGRDPSELAPRPGQKRPNILDEKSTRLGPKVIRKGFENDDIPKRRNPNTVSVFKRLSEKVYDEPIKTQRGVISKVIAAPKEIPSRQDVLDKQNKDEKFKARNRRMFGALLGTLQRFQQEESKLKKKEEKRTQIEKKIEEHEQQEKEEIKKERQELFQNRKKKQQEIKMIELKMLRMKEYTAWEDSQKPRTHFIVTKAKPHIHYLPRKMDDKSKELLEKSKVIVEEQIEKRRQSVFEELTHIEERMKKNFESKITVEVEIETKEATTEKHNRRNSDSEADEDGDVKMKSPTSENKEEKNGDSQELDKNTEDNISKQATEVPHNSEDNAVQSDNFSELQTVEGQQDQVEPEIVIENNIQVEETTAIIDNIAKSTVNVFKHIEVIGSTNTQNQISEMVYENMSEEQAPELPNQDI